VVGWREVRPVVPSAPRCAPSGGKTQAALAKPRQAEELKAKLLELGGAAVEAVLVLDDFKLALVVGNVDMLARVVRELVLAQKEYDREQAK